MLFTVIRSLPGLEEETPGHSIELAKKDKADTSDDDSDDDTDDGNEKTDLYFHTAFYYTENLHLAHWFYIKHQAYAVPETPISTPPPKA